MECNYKSREAPEAGVRWTVEKSALISVLSIQVCNQPMQTGNLQLVLCSPSLAVVTDNFGLYCFLWEKVRVSLPGHLSSLACDNLLPYGRRWCQINALLPCPLLLQGWLVVIPLPHISSGQDSMSSDRHLAGLVVLHMKVMCLPATCSPARPTPCAIAAPATRG